MSLRAYWAYAFNSDKPIEHILAVFNEEGSWPWQLGDSAWYGDYLNAQPIEGVRVRIHEFPSQASDAGVFVGPGTVKGIGYEQGYTALLQIRDGSSARKEDIDAVLLALLARINAENIQEIEPYD